MSLSAEALIRALDIGAQEAVVVMRWGLATIELAQGNVPAAEARLTVCLDAARAGGYRYWEACALTTLAQAARKRGALDRAAELLSDAHPMWDEIGHAWGQAFVWRESGALAIERGSLDDADKALERAESMADEASDPIRGLQVRLESGRLAAARGDLESARRIVKAVREAAAERGAGLVELECVGMLAEIEGVSAAGDAEG